jgi:hypothetical protein
LCFCRPAEDCDVIGARTGWLAGWRVVRGCEALRLWPKMWPPWSAAAKEAEEARKAEEQAEKQAAQGPKKPLSSFFLYSSAKKRAVSQGMGARSVGLRERSSYLT